MPRNIYNKKFIKKNLPPQYKKILFGYSIKMSNPQQNNIQNETEQIKKEINLLQDRKKKNEKSQIKWIRVKKGQSLEFSQAKKIQNIVKNIFQNKIEQIKKNTNLLQNILAQVKKRKIIWKITEENSKNAESFTKWIKSNQRTAWPITRWTWANRKNKKN